VWGYGSSLFDEEDDATIFQCRAANWFQAESLGCDLNVKPPPPHFASRRSSIVNRQSSCLSKTSSSWSLAIILRTLFHKTKEMQLLNLLILVSCQVWAKITMSGRLINCVLTCIALASREDRSISHLIVNLLYFLRQRAKRQKGCVVMPIHLYIDIRISIWSGIEASILCSPTRT
jgi:hypothetical protein